MSSPDTRLTFTVDVTNPGQFFACCGLFELIDRICPGTESWFTGFEFQVESDRSLEQVIKAISEAELIQLEPDNDAASPIRIGNPFNRNLDWWNDEVAGGKTLKVWAGSMHNVRIAKAMQRGIANVSDPSQLFNYAAVAYESENENKKVEPFYFDSRRGWNSQSRDIGFAPNSFDMTTAAFSAVEFLCLVGLQRFRPASTDKPRVFIYHPWSHPLPINLAQSVTGGVIVKRNGTAFSFEVGFRTDQRKHKAFFPATPITTSI